MGTYNDRGYKSIVTTNSAALSTNSTIFTAPAGCVFCVLVPFGHNLNNSAYNQTLVLTNTLGNTINITATGYAALDATFKPWSFTAQVNSNAVIQNSSFNRIVSLNGGPASSTPYGATDVVNTRLSGNLLMFPNEVLKSNPTGMSNHTINFNVIAYY